MPSLKLDGDATFTLQPGSIQGITQTATVDGAVNENVLTSQITVLGDWYNCKYISRPPNI